MARLTLGASPDGSCREYCHNKSPVAASSAWTLSPKACTNNTPSWTSGVPSFGPLGSDHVHADRKWRTLSLVIALSGEKPVESLPRRQVSQSPSGTRASIASVTGVILSSGFARAGGVEDGGGAVPATGWACEESASPPISTATMGRAPRDRHGSPHVKGREKRRVSPIDPMCGMVSLPPLESRLKAMLYSHRRQLVY